MQKVASFKIKGMQRDLSVSAFNPEYAYENKNIRIMPTDENTLLSIINEKGTDIRYINGIGYSITGTPIGQAVIDNELIVFSTDDTKDRIYKLWFKGDALNGTKLFEGNLNFKTTNPIETIVSYENFNVKKVYWTDGLSQIRVINVAATKRWNDTSFNFIRTLNLQEEVTIERNAISQNNFAPGVIQYAFTYYDKYGQESNIFYTSPLQYISYNDRGASPEDKVGNSFSIYVSNINKEFDYLRIYSIHRTSLNSTPSVKRIRDIPTSQLETKNIVVKNTVYSFNTKGTINADNPVIVNGGANDSLFNRQFQKETESNSIDVFIWTLNTGDRFLDFKDAAGNSHHVEVSQSNSNKVIRKVGMSGISSFPSTIYISCDNKEFEVSTTKKFTGAIITDDGTSGENIDPIELLYVGGDPISAETIQQKDNTLFYGNIKLLREDISASVTSSIKRILNEGLRFKYFNDRYITLEPPKGYYPYKNQLETGESNKIFKYLETYRLGVQFQHETGKWSEPVFLKDLKNTLKPIGSYNTKRVSFAYPHSYINPSNKTIQNELATKGYIRVRPIIVYPTLNDRNVICQGVLCPTVFNVQNRANNSPFAQSSWFSRPNAPFQVAGDDKNNWTPFNKSIGEGGAYFSKAGVLSNGPTNADDNYPHSVDKGTWSEFRHYHVLPNNCKRNAEIQCISDKRVSSYPYIIKKSKETIDNTDINKWVSFNREDYYVDQSIVTLHSPDIEFDDNVSNVNPTNIKLRIVGAVPITASASDVDVQSSTATMNVSESEIQDMPLGFNKFTEGSQNGFGSTGTSRFAYKGLNSEFLWADGIYGYSGLGRSWFLVYPWHRNGSLNNQGYGQDGSRISMLSKKRMSNLKYSYNNYYLSPTGNSSKETNVYPFYVEGNNSLTGISGVKFFKTDSEDLIKIPAPKNSDLPNIVYYGNVDQMILPSTGKYTTVQESDGVNVELNKGGGYPICIGMGTKNQDYSDITTVRPSELGKNYVISYTRGIDPIRMRYKSTSHAVIALNYTLVDSIINTLPLTYLGNSSNDVLNASTPNLSNNTNYIKKYFWGTESQKTRSPIFTLNISDLPEKKGIGYGWLWLGELYRDDADIVNRFGGISQEAIMNNQWIPCGDAVSLKNEDGSWKNYDLNIIWEIGDTYYQRYDHLKTYPYSFDDQNQITEIISFMCETKVNIDGRYDRNRGQISNLAISPINFNLLNPVYSQQNNFFNYRTIDSSKKLYDYKNTIGWSKTKSFGEDIDTWTNVTLASTLDLDGNKGSINSIKRLNNDLIVFQDYGISQILYNENMQISTTAGVPIEIANSGKVTGKRYLTNTIGCPNKWSICETPNGLYFIDDITKGIYLFNGQLNNISDKFGFHSWINKVSNGVNVWNPVDFKGFVTYYDKVNGDVFFINKEECLAFSEPLGQFTSFYSYEDTPYFANIEDKGIWIKEGTIWLHNEGDYNTFFGSYKPFYTTVIANPDMQQDKIFNNIEFRADSWDSSGNLLNTTFDTLNTWNEYQKGKADLVNTPNKPSTLKRKFRIWRANIPRDKTNKRDRMRNPWLYLKLSMEKQNTNKTILHDIMVDYFE